MAFVRHVNIEGDGDPFYEIPGVTLEDEEILPSEIIDETDILTDNRKKQRRKTAQDKQDFSDFAKLGGGQQGTSIITPQLALAAYQYLSTSVEPFRNVYLSETVLKRLMAQNVFFKSKQAKDNNNDLNQALYEAGKPADYFILILEGRCQVTVSKEKLVFETGPFSYFGIPAIAVNSNSVDLSSQQHLQCLTSLSSCLENPVSKTYIPDYSVVTLTETLYMKIHWAVYLAAFRATLMERHHKLDFENDEIFENYWEQGIPFTSSTLLSPIQPDSSNSLFTQSKKNRLSPVSCPASVPSRSSDRIKHKASVENSSLSLCPDPVMDHVPPNKQKEGKTSILFNNAKIPLTSMSHKVFSDKNSLEAGDSLDIVKKMEEDVNGEEEVSINGTLEPTNERTRLLYPSEA